MAEKKQTKAKNLTFKEKPLVRSGNLIYYGLPDMRFIAKLSILEKENELPTKITVELLDQLDAKNPRPIMKSERASLFDALDIAYIWIERAQAQSQA